MYFTRNIVCLLILLLGFDFAVCAQTTFYNTTPIIFPDVDPSPEPADPYPSSIEVSGMTGLISGVKVSLHNFQHDFPDAVDIMLEAPNGNNLVILSDVGAAADVSGLNIAIDDSAATYLPDNSRLTSGSFKPTNIGTDDIWPVGTPVASSNTSLSAFGGFGPNGTWRLYASNDVSGGMGSIAGGWSLTLYTVSGAVLGSRVQNFTARVDTEKNAVLLQWIFDTQHGDAAFHIEHSIDQRNWKAIGTVNPARSVSGQKTFQYLHRENINRNNYYRLNIPSDGVYYSSNIIAVRPADHEIHWKTYPNPASTHVMISAEDILRTKAMIQLRDVSGAIIDKRELMIGGGERTRYDLRQRSGIYYLYINCNGKQTAKQIFVAR